MPIEGRLRLRTNRPVLHRQNLLAICIYGPILCVGVVLFAVQFHGAHISNRRGALEMELFALHMHDKQQVSGELIESLAPCELRFLAYRSARGRLDFAVQSGTVADVRKAIQQYPPVVAVLEGIDPIHDAVMYGRRHDQLNMLLNAGYPPEGPFGNSGNLRASTAFGTAGPTVALLLLNYGANPADLGDGKEFQLAIQRAAAIGDLESVTLLLHHGDDASHIVNGKPVNHLASIMKLPRIRGLLKRVQ